MHKTMSAKDVAEIVTVTFDFEAEFPAATLSNASVVASVLAGTDPTPSAILLGAPQIQGQKVLQAITGGVAFVDYHLRCLVTVSSGGTALRSAVLPVRDA